MHRVNVCRGAVIFNPIAGRGLARRLQPAARRLLGGGFEWIATQRAHDAVTLAREAGRKYKVVVAFGGDGTVSDVARGIYGTDSVLGVLPAGTGNDVARNLGIRRDLPGAAETVLRGNLRRVDVGLVHGIPFVNNAGVGFDARVMEAVNAPRRRLRGRSAFIIAALRAIPSFQPFELTLSMNDGSTMTCRAMMLSVLNGMRFGGGMLAAPRARVDDGLLDVLLVRAMSKLRLLPLVLHIQSGRHLRHPAVSMMTARRVTVETEPALPINVDGDLRGTTPSEITVEAGALRVLV